jgi:hypothetical protein
MLLHNQKIYEPTNSLGSPHTQHTKGASNEDKILVREFNGKK